MHQSAEECSGISGGLSTSNTSQNESIERLNDYLSGLNQSIENVANGATELAGISSKLAENSSQVKDLCLETVHSSEDGRSEMKGMTESFKTLNATIGDLIRIIRATAETVDQIKGITVTIGDISSQTNLLSLNASIEAARAGDAGRGFAVVAGEVGALANQSTDAAVHISSLVEAITYNIEQINQKADDCLRDMERCTAGVERSNSSFDSIYTDITRATEAIGEIADGVGRINNVATNNAETTEKQATTVNQILELSGIIVKDSDKISNETEKLSDVSEKLNGFSSTIMNDLKNFTLE
jgi:methyl-accepting chemotaxis protein